MAISFDIAADQSCKSPNTQNQLTGMLQTTCKVARRDDDSGGALATYIMEGTGFANKVGGLTLVYVITDKFTAGSTSSVSGAVEGKLEAIDVKLKGKYYRVLFTCRQCSKPTAADYQACRISSIDKPRVPEQPAAQLTPAPIGQDASLMGFPVSVRPTTSFVPDSPYNNNNNNNNNSMATPSTADSPYNNIPVQVPFTGPRPVDSNYNNIPVAMPRRVESPYNNMPG
jgi:hypothetical protein